jgi:hypothetical protein
MHPNTRPALPEPVRRRFFPVLAALPLAAAVAQTSTTTRANTVKTSARIGIAGGGARVTAASRLTAVLSRAGLNVAKALAPQLEGFIQKTARRRLRSFVPPRVQPPPRCM